MLSQEGNVENLGEDGKRRIKRDTRDSERKRDFEGK